MDGSTGRKGKSSRNVLPRYKLGKTLGIGSFGKVKLAVHTLTGLKVAIKILDRQSVDNSEADKVRKEINIMRQLSHPHIVRLFEVIETPSNVYVVMEYMDSGELFYYLTENGKLPEDEARRLFQQIISAVEYCHHRMVVHRDLKPENLILDSEHNVKIADFGLGNVMRDGHFLKTFCGSPNYAAPELLFRQLYAGPEVDVWSCGVILYALLSGRLPFDDDNFPGLYAKIKSGIYPVANHLSESAQDLISKMLVVNPMKRISILEIRQHPWFLKHLPLYIAVPCPDYLNRTEKVSIIPCVISSVSHVILYFSAACYYLPNCKKEEKLKKKSTILFLLNNKCEGCLNFEKVDINVVKDMVQMGFDIHEVIGSLQNHLQNEVTVTYSLLLHSRSPVCVCHENVNQETLERMDDFQTYLQSVSPGQNSWTLGLKSQATPRETMLDVLGVFHSLNVKWKRIGDYNMKCLWSPPPSRYSVTTGTGIRIGTGDAVKFEIQLYKEREELYVLDLQQLRGPPFLFLEICAAFRALVA